VTDTERTIRNFIATRRDYFDIAMYTRGLQQRFAPERVALAAIP